MFVHYNVIFNIVRFINELCVRLYEGSGKNALIIIWELP